MATGIGRTKSVFRRKCKLINEPCSHSKKAADRRERLRDYVSRNPEVVDILRDDSEPDGDAAHAAEEFYTYGPDGLLEARKMIFNYSIPKAKERIAEQRQECAVDLAERKKIRFEWYNHCKTFETKALQFGDDRPLSYCSFSPNSKLLATGSWSGLIKLWSVPESENVHSFKGHRDRVSGLDFHPKSTRGQSKSSLNMVSGATDGTVHLWSFDR